VKVKVKDRLSRMGPTIGYHPITIRLQPLFSGDLGGRQHQLAKKLSIGRDGPRDANYGSLGNDENVHRRDGVDVSKGQNPISFMHDIGRYLSPDYLSEDRIPSVCHRDLSHV
jgi:hypothetical protein